MVEHDRIISCTSTRTYTFVFWYIPMAMVPGTYYLSLLYLATCKCRALVGDFRKWKCQFPTLKTETKTTERVNFTTSKYRYPYNDRFWKLGLTVQTTGLAGASGPFACTQLAFYHWWTCIYVVLIPLSLIFL